MKPAVSIAAVTPHPLIFWKTLHKNPTHGFFLGPAVASGHSSLIYMSLGEPRRVIRSLAGLRAPKGVAPTPRFVGVFGFEAGRLVDSGIAKLPKRPDPLRFPPVCFGDYDSVLKIDYAAKTTTVYGATPALLSRVRTALAVETTTGKQKAALRFSRPPQTVFSRMVVRAKESIAAGDIYQANLSLRFSAKDTGNPYAYYERLSRSNPSPYACLIKQDGRWLASCSPELLLRVDGRTVVTRPIAGTRPRGISRGDDRRKRGQLLVSPKERAEHIMLVDLERNDLGRVCAPGTVKVTERFAVERYSHVMHIVSEVRGRLARGRTGLDAAAALFPGGTITGCPKIKSIEIIEKLEGVSRGPFYGSAGYVCGNGDAAFNILIRTALFDRGRVYVQAGAGIVADSNARREYREVLAKARVLLEAGR